MITPFLFRNLYHSYFFFPRLLKKEINYLYFVFLLRNVAIGMVAVFEPIYFFFYFSESISRVLVFYSILFGGMALFCYFAVKIVCKVGIKRSIILSFPSVILYYLALWNIEKHFILLPLAVVFWLIAVLLFWMAINIYFGIASTKSRLGMEVSKFNIILGLSFAIGPIIGGLVLNQFGWATLFLVVIFTLFLTSLSLFFSPEIHEVYNVSVNQLLKEIIRKNFWAKAIAFGATGGEHIIKGVIWPLFLFLLGISFDSIGLIAAGALLIGSIFTFYIGTLSDRLPRARLVAVGSLLLSFSWLLKTVVRSATSAFLANIFYGITSAAALVPFTAIFYEEFTVSRSQIVVLREITLNIGRTLALLCFAILFLFTDKLYLAFFVAALVVPLFNLIHKNSR